MVGKQGMKQSGHRIFAYKERKFNTLGRQGLLDYFTPKADTKLIQHHFLMTHNTKLSGQEANAIAIELNKKYWEDRKEDIIPLVDSIVHFSRYFNITNLEAFAMTCYLYKSVGGNHNYSDKQVGDIIEKTVKQVNELRLTNWDKFMSILKEVT